MSSKPKKQTGFQNGRNTSLSIFDNNLIKTLAYAVLIDILADFIIFLLASGFNYVQSPEGLWGVDSVIEKLEYLNNVQDSQRASES